MRHLVFPPTGSAGWCMLALACCAGIARAATAVGTASATVDTPLALETPVVNQLFERYAPTVVLPTFDAGVPVVRILAAPAAPAPVALAGAAAGAAPAGGSVQAVRNADGSVSLNITGGGGLAHVVTRQPNGQLSVDFN